jgi:hypothetical protein
LFFHTVKEKRSFVNDVLFQSRSRYSFPLDFSPKANKIKADQGRSHDGNDQGRRLPYT